MKLKSSGECILSPFLFNLYSQVIFNEALTSTTGGININGVNINNIRYADDTLITSNNGKNLQKLMDKITDTFGLRLNANKTKYIIINKEFNIDDSGFTVNGTKIELVEKLMYLGSISTTVEVKIRNYG